MRKVSFRVVSSSSHSSGSISNLGSKGGGSIGILLKYQFSKILHLKNPLPLRAMGLNTFKHPWTGQVSYVFSLPSLVPLVLSMLLAEHGTNSIQTSKSNCTFLDGCSLASHSSQHVVKTCRCPIIRNLVKVLSVGWVFKGPPSLL